MCPSSASKYRYSPHHVTQRGNRHEPTFFEEGDFNLYLDGLADATPRFGVAMSRWDYFTSLLTISRNSYAPLTRLADAETGSFRRLHSRLPMPEKLVGTTGFIFGSYVIEKWCVYFSNHDQLPSKLPTALPSRLDVGAEEGLGLSN